MTACRNNPLGAWKASICPRAGTTGRIIQDSRRLPLVDRLPEFLEHFVPAAIRVQNDEGITRSGLDARAVAVSRFVYTRLVPAF